MTDILLPNPSLDDQHMQEISNQLAEVSRGDMTPESFESEYIPWQESSFHTFGRFETELKHDVAVHPQLAYELRAMPTEELLDVLHKNGVISTALRESGLLEARFAPDEEISMGDATDRISGIKHIFLGDSLGGIHDIDTLHDAGIAGSGTDTIETKPRKNKANNTYAAAMRYGIPVDIDLDGEIDRVDLREQTKTQFPEQWTTDDVLMGIMRVAEDGVVRQTYDSGEISVVGVVNGVQIDVRLNAAGQILTGFATGKKHN